MNLFKVALIAFSIVLTIPAFAQSTTNNKSPVTFIKDSAITALIEAKLALNKHISSSDIKVKTDHGVVTLVGTVNSNMEIDNLAQLAQSTTGVKKVDATQVKVKESNQPFTDLAITIKVKGLYIKEKLFGHEDVPALVYLGVETNNGVVYLSGTAANAKQIENAIKLAKSVSGVIRVESTVSIMK